MALYEKRLQDDRNAIFEQLRSMGDMTESVINNALQSLLSSNTKLAHETVLADHPINRKMRAIDKKCHAFIARHIPTGHHLRFISSTIRLVIILERIGDYAVTISREAVQLAGKQGSLHTTVINNLANDVLRFLQQALTSFYEGNSAAAKALMPTTANLETTLDTIYADLIDGKFTDNDKDKFALFAVISQIKRVADQAKNICEETVFAVTGETKANKVFSILFLDEDNSRLGKMAEAIARKNYPMSGNYDSVGKTPAAEVDTTMVQFLDQKGIDISRARTNPTDLASVDLTRYHLIVSLDSPVESYIGSLPFHTAALYWELTQPDDFETTYRELSVHIRDVMEILRGEGAN